MYTKFKSCVRNNGKSTETFDVTVGVLQGEALSPFLFSMYLNDFESFLMKNGSDSIEIGMLNLFLILYADDTVIISESAEGLQKQLNDLYDYCNEWKLKVNTLKTKIVIFRNRGKVQATDKWYYDENCIEVVNSFNYLGLLLNYNGKFTVTEKLIASQGRKAMFAMKRSCKNLILNVETSIYLFNTYVTPILNYGCETWGHINTPNIEKVHLRFLKCLLGVNINTPNCIIYNETGIFPLYVNRQITLLKYWCKILTSNNCILKGLYVEMYKNCDSQNNWATNIKSILNRIGMSYIWSNQEVINVDAFIKEVNQKIKDIFIQNNGMIIERSSKCHLYKHITTTFCIQNYLTKCLPVNLRKAITKMRCSSHKLMIEKGRYLNLERNQRVCSMCNLNDIEDEFHFILRCPAYYDLRKKYLKQRYCNRPSVFKLLQLFNTCCLSELRKLGYYIINCNRRGIFIFICNILHSS